MKLFCCRKLVVSFTATRHKKLSEHVYTAKRGWIAASCLVSNQTVWRPIQSVIAGLIPALHWVCVVIDNSSGLLDQCDSTQQLYKALPTTSCFFLPLPLSLLYVSSSFIHETSHLKVDLCRFCSYHCIFYMKHTHGQRTGTVFNHFTLQWQRPHNHFDGAVIWNKVNGWTRSWIQNRPEHNHYRELCTNTIYSVYHHFVEVRVGRCVVFSMKMVLC